MKVFVSSTVFDLVDIRAEVSFLLGSMGILPVLSDEKLSEFDTAHATNSIETCLINVDNSDEVLLILDKRYGPRLGKLGFPDVSATHLEYRRARDGRKQIHVFVRDRLEADYTTWKKNGKRADIRLPWVDQSDYGVFDILDEHRKLSSTDSKNWFSIYTNSVDLRSAVKKLLEPRIKPARVIDAISQNRFPIFDFQHETERFQLGNVPTVKFQVLGKNVGGAPAFNYVCRFESDEEQTDSRHIVAPGQAIDRTIIAEARFKDIINQEMRIEYDAAIGVRIRESYQIRCYITGHGFSPALMSGVHFKGKTYHNAPEIQVVISDS